MPAMAAGPRLAPATSAGSRAAAAVLPGLQRPPVFRPQQLGSAGHSKLVPHSLCSAGLSARQRWRVTRTQAAADAAAAGGEGEGTAAPPPPPPQKQKQKPARELSMQQRWRAAKFAAQEALQRLSHTAPVAAVLRALAAVDRALQPLYTAWAALQRSVRALMLLYEQFLLEETKRQWRWSKLYAREYKWWSNVPPYLGYLAATLVYELFIPVSLLAAVALPLCYAWVMWDDWWRSPIVLGLLLTAPLKWVPWAPACLVWPGVI